MIDSKNLEIEGTQIGQINKICFVSFIVLFKYKLKDNTVIMVRM